MRLRGLIAIALAGCGRIGFDLPPDGHAGILDRSFGNDGMTIATNPKASVQSESMTQLTARFGGYVGIGTSSGMKTQMGLVAFDQRGIVDTGYAQSGFAEFDVNASGITWGYGLARTGGDRMVVVGTVNNSTSWDLVIGEVDATGSSLPSFGGNGMKYFNVAQDDRANRVVLMGTRAVACGTFAYNTVDSHFGLVGVTLDGSLDPGFGSGGMVDQNVTTSRDDCVALAVDASQRIVAGGARGDAMVIERFLANGAIDATFPAFVAGDSMASVNAIAVAADGEIIAVGHTGGYPALVRLRDDGTPLGVTTLPGLGRFFGLALQSDGGIITVGEDSTGMTDGTVVRWLPTGELDPEFADGGIFHVGLNAYNSLQDVVLDSDGRIVAAGYEWISLDNRPFIIALR